MIGTRDTISFAVALSLVTISLGPGGPRPEIAIGADRLVAARASTAADHLGSLLDDLTAALDTSRSGAAAIVAGDRSPGDLLRDAADMLAATGERAAVRVEAGVRALEAARHARDPSAEAIPRGAAAGDVASISAQLEATVEAADLFAEMRRRAVNVPSALGAALAAMRQRDLDTADERLATAADDQAAVAGWDVDFATLPVWVAATDATIDAVRRLLAAVRNGDAPAAERAAADFAALEDDATRADRALQITISEGGGSVATAPLSRLDDALDRVAAQQAFVAAVLAGDDR